MRVLIVVFLLLGGAAYYYQTRQQQASVISVDASPYHCDGRIYCSQMTSCQEALYFLKNCPGTKMNGDGDNVPCEKEWCGHAIPQ